MEKLKTALQYIKSKTDFVPNIAIVLGSGLGAFGNKIETACSISYADIPHFPTSTVTGHAGKFILGTLAGKKVIAMQGRVHYYEGYSMEEVVLPIRLMHLLGAKTLILTNAAGGVNLGFKPGNLMLICDHIASFVPSPLIGKNKDALGTRFPDMSKVYDPDLCAIARAIAAAQGICLQEGVYLQFTGPAYETPAEIRMARTLGADAVGMSTAIEAMAARHCGMRVCGISCITNMASGITDVPLAHDEVKETAAAAEKDFTSLLQGLIQEI